MALELQSQAMGALQSVAGVALSLRSYKEQKDRKETNESYKKELHQQKLTQRDEAFQASEARKDKVTEQKLEKYTEYMDEKINQEKSKEDYYSSKAFEARASGKRQNAIARERNFNVRQQKAALKASQSSEDAAAVAEAALSDRTTAINMASTNTVVDNPWKRRIVSDAVAYKGGTE